MGFPRHAVVAVMSGVCLFICAATSRSETPFELVRDDVVVFLGGTDMVHLQQSGHLEAILTRAFASQQPKFRDLAWEADTVFRQGTVIERWRQDGHGDLDGFGDLEQQLKSLGTTVVIAQFGRLGAMAGDSGLVDWTDGYSQLVGKLSRGARQVVLVSPVPFEKPVSDLVPDLSRYNASLRRYVQAMERIAARQGASFVDLFTDARPGLTANGIHVKPLAQRWIAERIAGQLGVAVATEREVESLRRAVIEKHRLWYDYWRPANWKLLYGDDARRQFTRGGKDYIPFKEEWKQLVPLVQTAERRVWRIAAEEEDPGANRPAPEILHGDPHADIDEELAAFSTWEGFQVNLFASEREGLTSPLAIRWDPAGRAYVAVTTTYPHVYPGDLPNDKIIMLEDRDADGAVDRSTVFAEGLNIPTGIEWGEGGIYVGQNTEILFLKDTDGDRKADVREVVLGGFGNGDSHQTINSFFWSPDGELFFGHGDGCESRVETPWGASHLFNAGFYRLRPRRLQLIPFLEGHMGPGNPWGIAFDAWGQVFNVDGAGGVNWLSPGMVSTTHVRRLRRIGDPGGYCGIGYLDGGGIPAALQGNFVTGDFKANRVKMFSLQADESGYQLDWQEPILKSRHRNFRPVDVKVGPDGAIYVVDWYNPITCHQDDAYRDPTRDKRHGRIWRLATEKSSVRPPDLQQLPTAEVVRALGASEYWTRYQAKRALTERESQEVSTALDVWVRSLDPKQPDYEFHLYQAIGAYATIERVEPRLLLRLLNAQDPRARAFASRLVGRWHDRLDNPLKLLADRIRDEHPQVRLEAVVACAAIPAPRSIQVAAGVVDQPRDHWIDYAFKQTVHRLRPWWQPAFQQGKLTFASPSHLATVLNEAGGREALESLKSLVESGQLDAGVRASAIASILAVGGPEELQSFGLDPLRYTSAGRYDVQSHAGSLRELIKVTRFRDEKPSGDLAAQLRVLIQQGDADLYAHALTLAGLWDVGDLKGEVMDAAENGALPVPVRSKAFMALADLDAVKASAVLHTYAADPHSSSVRAAAIEALAVVDPLGAAQRAAKFLSGLDLLKYDPTAILRALLERKGGANALSNALQSESLDAATATGLLRALFSSGRSDPSLLSVLQHAIGSAGRPPQYSVELVEKLAQEANETGDATRGRVLFGKLACASCHKVSGAGGRIGPDLTAIGTTLSPQRIVEEVLWPSRQIKEGYSMLTVITEDGKVHQGYERRTVESQEAGQLVLESLSTSERITIEKAQIEETRVTGSAMPAGLMALLSGPQLLDLIQYLRELGKLQ
ncbi:MAG: PVC-type heme-binding CxxCH protein [Planctomycetota bacterium]|nr:PVC-type heme-binding CxxCH protein [Planctomycetota bacterium]